LADFANLGNRLSLQAFDMAMEMEIERPLMSRAKAVMNHAASWNDLPSCQAGLAAALHRAFVIPADDHSRQFDELLRQLH